MKFHYAFIVESYDTLKVKEKGIRVLYCIMKHTIRKLCIYTLRSSIIKLFSNVVLATELITSNNVGQIVNDGT